MPDFHRLPRSAVALLADCLTARRRVGSPGKASAASHVACYSPAVLREETGVSSRLVTAFDRAGSRSDRDSAEVLREDPHGEVSFRRSWITRGAADSGNTEFAQAEAGAVRIVRRPVRACPGTQLVLVRPDPVVQHLDEPVQGSCVLGWQHTQHALQYLSMISWVRTASDMSVIERVRTIFVAGTREGMPSFQRSRSGPGTEIGSFEMSDLAQSSGGNTLDLRDLIVDASCRHRRRSSRGSKLSFPAVSQRHALAPKSVSDFFAW